MRAARIAILLAAIWAAGLSPAAVRPAAAEPAGAASSKRAPREGHPKVKLDRLEFPSDVPNAHNLKKHLRKVLRHEAYRADWGAGRGTTIEYRFFVRELSLEDSDGVLHVRCTAYGKLPSGKTAKSHLEFGGAPSKRNRIIKRVLEIVSRGAITRLAELERVRRGDLHKSRVHAPH